MAAVADDTRIVVRLARVTDEARVAAGGVPLVCLVTVLTEGGGVRSPEVISIHSVTRQAFLQGTCLLMGKMAVAAWVLHRGVCTPGHCRTQRLVAIETGSAGR